MRKRSEIRYSAILPDWRNPATLPDYLPDGWAQATAGGMATNPDKQHGGIVDKAIASGQWFYVSNREDVEVKEGFATRKEAISALAEANAKVDKQAPVVANETASDAPQAPLSRVDATQANPAEDRKAKLEAKKAELLAKRKAAAGTQTAPKQSVVKSNVPPNQRGSTLLNAILRVTGGDGIHSSMALDTTGDTAKRQPKLRGLFTNRGTIDLGDVAMRLRESEGFDVRDGEHLSALIRRASAGERITDMETQQREAEANKIAEYKDHIRKQAVELGLKTAFVEFSVLEGKVHDILANRQAKLKNAMGQRSQDVFDSMMEKSKALVSDEDVDAVLLDVHQNGFTGREFQDEAARLLKELVAEAEHTEEGNRKLQEAADAARDEENIWIGQDDEGTDSRSGGSTEGGGRTAAQQGEVSDLSGQSNQSPASEEFDLSGQTAEEIAAASVAAQKAQHDEMIAKVAEERKKSQRRWCQARYQPAGKVDAIVDAFQRIENARGELQQCNAKRLYKDAKRYGAGAGLAVPMTSTRADRSL